MYSNVAETSCLEKWERRGQKTVIAYVSCWITAKSGFYGEIL
jgi:hypothetical protein